VRGARDDVYIRVRWQPDHNLPPGLLKARINVTDGETLHAKRPSEALDCSLRREGDIEHQLEKRAALSLTCPCEPPTLERCEEVATRPL
jgi:hypothetical protein